MANLERHVYRGVEGTVKQLPVNMSAELGPHEVLVKITHSGLCGTDIHYIPFGIALGHEGVGIVEKVGSEVTQFKVGERAGGGYHRNVSQKNYQCTSSDSREGSVQFAE
jgi:D-arabinose 1-dehydrogenase-like Zn-dependent alcohol dehydrogenase